MQTYTIKSVTWNEAQAMLRAIREQVFIREQHVPEALEWDGLDAEAVHLLALDAAGNPIATARLLAHDGVGHLGRMAVLQDWRAKGVGAALLKMIMVFSQQKALKQIVLNAQTYAVGFYEKAGFCKQGEEFMDAGIPHYRMVMGGSPSD